MHTHFFFTSKDSKFWTVQNLNYFQWCSFPVGRSRLVVLNPEEARNCIEWRNDTSSAQLCLVCFRETWSVMYVLLITWPDSHTHARSEYKRQHETNCLCTACELVLASACASVLLHMYCGMALYMYVPVCVMSQCVCPYVIIGCYFVSVIWSVSLSVCSSSLQNVRPCVCLVIFLLCHSLWLFVCVRACERVCVCKRDSFCPSWRVLCAHVRLRACVCAGLDCLSTPVWLPG